MTRRMPHSNLAWVFVLVLGTTNALLVQQNLRLRQDATTAVQLRAIRVGDRVSGFQGWGYLGDDVDVAYGDTQRSKVLLYLSPSCVYCGAQMQGWRALVASMNQEKYDVYAIVGDHETAATVRNYLESAGLSAVAVAFVPSAVRGSYGLRYTPTTMVVTGDGTILHIWTGLWNEQAQGEAVEVFGIDPSTIE